MDGVRTIPDLVDVPGKNGCLRWHNPEENAVRLSCFRHRCWRAGEQRGLRRAIERAS